MRVESIPLNFGDHPFRRGPLARAWTCGCVGWRPRRGGLRKGLDRTAPTDQSELSDRGFRFGRLRGISDLSTAPQLSETSVLTPSCRFCRRESTQRRQNALPGPGSSAERRATVPSRPFRRPTPHGAAPTQPQVDARWADAAAGPQEPTSAQPKVSTPRSSPSAHPRSGNAGRIGRRRPSRAGRTRTPCARPRRAPPRRSPRR